MSALVCLCFGPAGHSPDAAPPAGLEPVAAAFPTVEIGRDAAVTREDGAMHDNAAVTVHAGSWCRGAINLYHLDHQVDALADGGLVTVHVMGEGALWAAPQVLTRCQRWVGRRNARSRGSAFERVLALHRELHERDRGLNKPLIRADYNHALDVWQWLLRLCPEASEAAQIAALFHDIERLVSEADVRIEHHAAAAGGAAGYDAFKHAHARGGARMAYDALGTIGVDDDLRARVAHLIERHERRPGPDEPAGPNGRGGRDAELASLGDADGLSFFSLNSGGFLDYYGPAHTRHKIAWTLARMSARARLRLPRVRLRPDVARLVHEANVTETLRSREEEQH